MSRFSPSIVAVCLVGCVFSQSASAQRQMEALGRGVVAMRSNSTQVYVGWRLLGNDPQDVAFNLYRSANGAAAVKVNSTPLTATTDYVDTPASLSTTAYAYSVRPVVAGVEVTDIWANPSSGAFSLPANPPTRQYLPVPLQPTPDGALDVKFCWVGDLDGDGEFDFVVDRQSGEGFRQFLEAYKRDGTLLWRIDLGANSFNKYNNEPGSSSISIGHGDNVTVYDMDGDGKAEVLLRTANGVVFGNGSTVSGGTTDNHQFLSVVDGLTGAELARAAVPNPRVADGPMNGHLGILYLDGKRPSVIWAAKNRDSSGDFHGVITTWDWRNNALTQRWSWVDDGSIHSPEGHQIRIADVDNDGKDEFVEIGFVIDDDGTQLFNVPEMVHGDRFHVTDIDPDHPGLETFIIQQNNGTGLATAIFDSGSGSMIRKWYAGGVVDVGRGVVGDFDPAVKGCEFFSTQPGIFDCKGNQLTYAKQPFPPETIWWDSDLVREFVSTIGSSGTSPGIDKFNPADGSSGRVISLYSDSAAPGYPYNNYIAYGGRPQFWGDILGDWREELMCVASDNSELRIYSVRSADTAKSSNGTPFRIPTLMHNPQYRCQATTKGYVQSSYTDYYLGTGMTPPPPPPMVKTDLVWRGGTGTTAWDNGATSSWFQNGAAATFTAGSAVLFDIGADSSTSVALNGVLQPGALTVYSPKNQIIDGTAGSLSGAMKFVKAGEGSLTISGSHAYTGATTVWDGAFFLNGTVQSSPVTVWGGTWGGALSAGLKGGRIGGTGTFSQAVTLAYRGAVTPGSGMGNAGTLTFGSGLTAQDGSYFALDLSNDPVGPSSNDRVAITGNLSVSGKVGIVIKALNGVLAPGTYTLVTYTGTLTGNVSNFTVTVPSGTPYTLAAGAGTVTLTVPVTRVSASIVWRGSGSNWDLALSQNWLNGGSPDVFVAGDTVTFDATGTASATAILTSALPVAGVTVNSSTGYTLSGSGSISGTGGLSKAGSGTLVVNTVNDYTGATTINGGVLAVASLADAGTPSSIGAAGAGAGFLVLNGGTLRLTGSQTNTNRSMTLGASGGTLDVGSSMQVSGTVTGSGALTKTGPGTLILAKNNSYTGGTVINQGTIYLAGSTANTSALGTGSLTFNNGSLTMADVRANETAAWNMIVPAGMTGRLNADGRCSLTGSLTGLGDFTYYSPYVRSDMKGNWSAFTGRISLATDADGSEMRVTNTFGFGTAALDIGAGSYVYYNITNSSPVINIGELTGDSTSGIGGGPSGGNTVTWRVGGRNTDATFGGAIVNGSGPTAIEKAGTGTWVLAGVSSHTGATNVSAGKLVLTGSLSGSAVTVQSGAGFGGTGSVTGNVVFQTGSTMLVVPGLSPLAITGNLTASGSVTVSPMAGTVLAPGSYTICTFSGTLSGSPVFQWSGSGFTATFNTSVTGTVTMDLAQDVARAPGNLTWTGAASGDWDEAASNWTYTSGPVSFVDDDSVFFDETSTATTVNLTGTRSPASTSISGANHYSFVGAGSIAGTGPLVKSGAGTLTLGNAHAYSGGTYLNGGTLYTSTETAMSGIGTGPIIFQGGTLQQLENTGTYSAATYDIQVASGQSGTLRCDSRIDLSGTLVGGGSFNVYVPYVRTKVLGDWSAFTGDVNVTTDGDGGLFRLANPTGLPNASVSLADKAVLLSFLNYTHTMPVGSLVGVAGSYLSGSTPDNNNPPGGTVVTWQIGGKNLDSIFAGIIQNGNGTSLTALQKTGTGTLTLSGASTYTGITTVSSGKLVVTGSLAATATTVATTGFLGGNGTIGGAVICNGTLSPGVSIGTLTLSSGLTLASTSTLDYELGSASDLTFITGNLTLDGTVNVTAAAGFGPGTYTLVTYTGGLTNNTLNVGSVPSGFTATVNTATPGQVCLVVAALNSPPLITSGPTALPSTVITATTSVSVLATDDGGEGSLNYTWSSTGPAAVAFSPNATNSGKEATATFTAPGSYTLKVTVGDVPGLTTMSTTPVTVVASPFSLTVNPPSSTLEISGSLVLGVSAHDQFGAAIATPAITWSASGGGTISQAGLYTATAAGGPWQATATGGGLDSSASITVNSRTFEAWVTSMFTPEQMTAGESAMTADPDHDGLTNLAEYALGGLPYTFTAQPTVTSDSTSMSINFQRPASVGDVAYHAEAGPDIITWSELILEVLNPGSDPEDVRATYYYPISRPDLQFLRLRFEK